MKLFAYIDPASTLILGCGTTEASAARSYAREIKDGCSWEGGELRRIEAQARRLADVIGTTRWEDLDGKLPHRSAS